MTFSGPYEGIQRPYGRICAGGEKKSKPWLPTGVIYLSSDRRTVREPELFSIELSRTFDSGSVQNVGRTPALHI